MEDILASIKRIITDDGESPATGAAGRPPGSRADGATESAAEADVLELNRPLDSPQGVAAANDADPTSPASTESQAAMPQAQPAAAPTGSAEIVSTAAADASRHALAALSALIVKPEQGDNTLEGLVRELLRPMLRAWLDAELPTIVERLVAGEIARISGRQG